MSRKLSCVLTVALLMVSAEARSEQKRSGRPQKSYKNVIFLVPDGCSQSIQTLARWYKGSDLTVDSLNAGMVKIHMTNSVITGSAAAATAFAAGSKTTVRFLGVAPRTNDPLSKGVEIPDPEKAYAPMASILEAAREMGKSTGLVATSRITHATPAAFACHIADRGWDNEIMEDMVYGGLTVALGGGRRHLLPTEMGGKRTDGENLEQVLLDRGYTVVTTKDEMDAASVCASTKLWGAFDMSHMDAEIDRARYNPHQPSLAEMAAKAIDVLSQNEEGFFLMVEASQVDWAGHNNDPIWMVTDFLAFDDAVKVAVDFAEEDGETMVIAFADHNTGGMKIGHYDTAVPYTATTVEDLVEPLKRMKVTAESVVAEMGGDYSDENMIATLQEWWGVDSTPEEVAEIREYAEVVGMAYSLARVISRNHTVIGWTTHGHNGEDVPVWIYPQGEAIGVVDNTDLAHSALALFGPRGADARTLEEVTERLYIQVDDVFPGEWELDKSDPANPVLVVKGCVEMPISKDLLLVPAVGVQVQLGSLVVAAPLRDGDAKDDGSIHTIVEERVYIPRKAVRIIRLVDRLKRAKGNWGRGLRRELACD